MTAPLAPNRDHTHAVRNHTYGMIDVVIRAITTIKERRIRREGLGDSLELEARKPKGRIDVREYRTNFLKTNKQGVFP